MPENRIDLDYDGMKLVRAKFKMQLGVLPSVGYVEMTGNQWNDDFAGVGHLTIQDGNTYIRLHNLKATRVRKVEGLNGTSLARVELKDRRWQWRLKTFSGRFNVVISNDDGNVIYDPDTIDGGSPYTFDDIARILLAAMGETSVPLIPIPTTSYIPLNKVWENVNPAAALQEICEEVNYAVALKATDNKVEIVHLGSDLWPVVGDRYKMNEGAGATFHDKPDYVKVIGNRIQNEIDVALEPVGIDVDGEVRKLENLAYVPNPADPDDGTGFGKSALLSKPFSNITGGAGYTAEQAQALAEKSVFKYFRIPDTGLYPDDANRDNFGLLPILKTINTLDSSGLRRLPYVQAKYYEKDQKSGFNNLGSLQPPKVSYRIRHRRGLVIFGKRVGTLLNPDVTILSQTKLISVPGSVQLTFACELKSDGDEDFYYYLKSDQATPPPVDNALVLPVKRSDLTLRRIGGVDRNREELDTVADAIADIFLNVQEKENNLNLEYAGAQAINPNGNIEFVEWEAGDTIVTRLRYCDFTPPAAAACYLEQGPLARLSTLPAENRLALEAAGETNLQGAGMRGDSSSDDPSSMEYQSLEVINSHHSGVIIVKDSRDEAVKDVSTHEDYSFGEVTSVAYGTHQHIISNVGKLLDMRYCNHYGYALRGWLHGSFLDIETTKFYGHNPDNWHRLGDNWGMGFVLPIFTRFYYGMVPNPDPTEGDPAYHSSQVIDPRRPTGYVPGGVEDVNRIKVYGEMKSAPGCPCILGMPPGEEEGLISRMGYSFNYHSLGGYLPDFGATWGRKTLTYIEVARSPWDVNHNTLPPPETEGLWGMAEYVRFKIFIDPDRTQEE